MLGAAGSIIRTGHFGVWELLRTGHAMPQGITLGLTITAAAKRKTIHFQWLLLADRGGLAPMSEPTASKAALARSPDRPIMATVRGLASAPLTLATARSGAVLSSRIWSSNCRSQMTTTHG